MAVTFANLRFYLSLALATLVTVICPLRVSASVLFVGNKHSVAEYSTAGKVVNRSLISGIKLTFLSLYKYKKFNIFLFIFSVSQKNTYRYVRSFKNK